MEIIVYTVNTVHWGLQLDDTEEIEAHLQSDPTDRTGYVSLFLSRTGIHMPVRLGLHRHMYACATGYTGIPCSLANKGRQIDPL